MFDDFSPVEKVNMFDDFSPAEDNESFLDRAKDVATTYVDNLAEPWRYGRDFIKNTAKNVVEWAGEAYNANMEYQDALERAGTAGTIFSTGPTPTQEEINNKANNAYDTTIGRPAMRGVMTPYIPVPARAALGVAMAPTMVRDAMNAYDTNVQEANETGGSWAGAVGNTVKNVALDPIVEPVKAWATNPIEQVNVIRQEGLGAAYDNVLAPFEVGRGIYHAGKAVTPKRVKTAVGNVVDNVREHTVNMFDDFKLRKPSQNMFDDFLAKEDLTISEPQQAINAFDSSASEWNADAPTDMQRAIYDRLRSDGFLTDKEAAAFTGNIAQETRDFNTKAISDDGHGSQGLVQWTDTRLTDLMRFAEENYSDPYDWRTQVDFLKHELRTTESAALERLRENPNATVEEMAHIVRESYERPDPAKANDEYRMQKAREVYDGQVGPHNDTVRSTGNRVNERLNQSSEEAYNPTIIDFSNETNAVEVGSGKRPNFNLFEEPEQQNQIAYHGTGYKFDAFDNAKANTGAGQQNHGAGTYFASDKSVAKMYRDGVKEKTGEGYLKKVDIPENDTLLYENYPLNKNSQTTINNIKTAIDNLGGEAKAKMISYLKDKTGYREYLDDYQEITKRQEFVVSKANNLAAYLNGDKVSTLKLKSALKTAGVDNTVVNTAIVTKAIDNLHKQLDDIKRQQQTIEANGRKVNALTPDMIEQQPSLLIDDYLKQQTTAKALNGRDIYRGLREALGDDVAASRYLDVHGVDGLSYHDLTEGNNFVIFNPDKAKILDQDVQYMRKTSGDGPGIFVQKGQKKYANSESSYQYIKPAELADKIKSKEINPKFREYDEAKLAEYAKYSEGELFEQVKKNIVELKDGVNDPLGNKVKVMLDADNVNALDNVANAFMRGHGEGDVSLKRAFATSLIKETASNPDLILRQANGRNAYVAYWKGTDNINHEIIVSLDNADKGKIISSHVTSDGPRRRTHSIKKFIADTKKADAIVYVSDNIRNELEGRLSQYRRPPSSDRVSPLDTQLHPSSNLNIADGTKKVKPDEVQNFSDNSKSPYRYVEGEENLSMDRAVSRKEIFKAIDENFKGIRHGRIGKRGVEGFYNTRTDAIRVRNYGDFEAASHELGHYIDKQFSFTKNNAALYPELIENTRNRFGEGYEQLGEAGIAKEGFAEFFRDYTTNRSRAKVDFPQFYDTFKQLLARDKELNARVEKVSALLHQWYKQHPEERIKGSISFGGKESAVKSFLSNPKEGIKKLHEEFYTKAVDEYYPLKVLVEEVESKTGKKLATEDNPFMQAWLYRGFQGKAEAMLEYSTKDFMSLKDALKGITKEKHEDFSTYVTARHDLDILKWNLSHPKEKIFTERKMNEVIATIKKYESSPDGKAFKEAQKRMIHYSNQLLELLVNEGMLTREAVNAMREKHPNYVPFFRDFGKEGIQDFGKSGNGFMNVQAPVKKMKGSSRDIIDPLEGTIRNTIETVKAIERNRVAKAIVKISDFDGMSGLVEKVEGTATANDSSFYVFKNGEKQVYQTTPEIYKIMKNMNSESMNTVTRIFSYPTKWLRAGATQLSPAFVIANLIRDTVTATLLSKHGFIPVIDNILGMRHVLNKDKVFREFLAERAGNSTRVSRDRDYIGNKVRSLLKSGKGQTLKDRLSHPIDLLQALNEAVEMAPRVAEFANAQKGHTGIRNRIFNGKKQYISNSEAAIHARDVTLDFSRTGSQTKAMNKVIAFFNATIQGNDKLIRAFKEQPARMTFKSVALITIPSIALQLLNLPNPEYQEIPQWEKDMYWHIPLPTGGFVKMPKPFELGVLFGTLIERSMQYAYGDKRAFKGLDERIIDTFTPSMIPTGLAPIMEWMTNYNFFTQRNIVPQYQEKLPSKYQYGNNTSWVARKAGEALDGTWIGDKIGSSPYKIDNTIRGYTGTAGSLILEGIDSITGVADTRPTKKANEAPILRNFTTTPYKSSESIQRLYDEYNKQEGLLNATKLTGKKQEGFDARSYNMTKQAHKQLQQLNKASKQIRESERLSAQQKREKLDVIEFQKVNAARRGLGLQPVSK